MVSTYRLKTEVVSRIAHSARCAGNDPKEIRQIIRSLLQRNWYITRTSLQLDEQRQRGPVVVGSVTHLAFRFSSIGAANYILNAHLLPTDGHRLTEKMSFMEHPIYPLSYERTIAKRWLCSKFFLTVRSVGVHISYNKKIIHSGRIFRVLYSCITIDSIPIYCTTYVHISTVQPTKRNHRVLQLKRERKKNIVMCTLFLTSQMSW